MALVGSWCSVVSISPIMRSKLVRTCWFISSMRECPLESETSIQGECAVDAVRAVRVGTGPVRKTGQVNTRCVSAGPLQRQPEVAVGQVWVAMP